MDALPEKPEPLKIEPMSPAAIGKALDLREAMMMHPKQIAFDTRHLFHAGMYGRTIKMPARSLASGTLVKIPMILVVSGHCRVYVGEDTHELEGYHVIEAAAGRMQAVYAIGETFITAFHATQKTTVAEVEAEATDEIELLRLHRETAQLTEG